MASTRVWLSQGRGGRGKSAPPEPMAGHPGPEPPGRPPSTVGSGRQGTKGPPPLPPPRLKSGRRPAGETAAPHSPQGAAAARGGTRRPRQAQRRAKRPQWTARALLHYPLPTDNGAAAPRKAQTEQPTQRPAWGRRGPRTRARRSLPPRPPPALPQRPTGSRPGRARCPRPPGNPHSTSIPKGGAPETKDDRGADHGPPNGAGGRGAAERPPPPRSPPGLRAAGAPALRPPGAERRSPLPQKGPRRQGGNAAGPARRAPRRPPRSAPAVVAADRLARTSAPERRTDHALGRRATTNRNSMGASPETHAVLSTRGGRRQGLGQPEPPGERFTGRPPPPPPPGTVSWSLHR